VSQLTQFAADFSAHRLNGDPVPDDLAILLAHREELAKRTGIVLNASPGWAPWLDTSYLRESDWANPDIRANVRAIGEVCKVISFVAQDEDANYLGYWRGPTRVSVSQAAIVCLDNEGQFDFCGTTNMAGAILTRGGRFEELRSWLVNVGVGSLPSGRYDLFDLDIHPSPRELHEALYAKYSAEERAA
jgi:hypothetical protein